MLAAQPLTVRPALPDRVKGLRDLTARPLLPLPDLVISAIGADTRDDGTVSDVVVQVTNVGRGPAGSFSVQYNALLKGQKLDAIKPGVGTQQTIKEGLAPGQSRIVLFRVIRTNRPVEQHVFTVDALNQVKESNEDNNRRVLIIPAVVSPRPPLPALPDLVIDKVEFVGQEIRATIKNIGTAPAGTFLVKRQFKLKGVDMGSNSVATGGVFPGQSKTVFLGLLSANPVDRLEITIDPLNQVRESRRDNNFGAFRPTPPDGGVSGLTFRAVPIP
jgi:subtilase family serine protease